MKKEGITKAELPESMKKVDKALECNFDGNNNAYLLIKQTFPSKGCKATNDQLNGKEPSKSALSNVKPLSVHFKILLGFHGVDEETIFGYEQSFLDDRGNLCETRRDYNGVSFDFQCRRMLVLLLFIIVYILLTVYY